ncbi:MAG: phage tail protein [Synergistaceae bacterium]|nr:phage tail protein [Synergistaceae bacterium]
MAYNSILTDIGLAKINNQPVTGIPLVLTHMALGDGNGSAVTPQQSATALAHEVYRGQINHLYVPENDAAQIIAELVILPNVGGWTVREVGIFDEDGDMIIYASHPAIYKPALAEGSGMDYTVAVHALIGNDVNVTLKIDPGVVIAVRSWVTGQFSAHNADPDAHNKCELPWIDAGTTGLTRTGDTTFTLAGDVRTLYPKGKRLRVNGSDDYLCRVFGDATYADGLTTITVWFDDRTKAIPAAVTKFERSRLTPQDTANGASTNGTADAATIDTLLASYCYGSYVSND